ncbi:uncharacterized protein LOC119114833 [Pollicipes pollicipes]|uniref:uncharacterized protein LOC119114833 n=1 Tax=Pollicipes pollicipes TaxID=41117 RepID=UPI0018855DDB|nr:uncharacterized protein LOC119114833 [Pollicipes pollicipes]
MLVEAEVLRSQLAALGGDPKRDPGGGDLDAAPEADPRNKVAALQRTNGDLRLQLEERRIELEGTRARLRQLETPSPSPAGAARPRAGRPAARWGGASLSASPHDRSLGHSSIPVLVRAASPTRQRRRPRSGHACDGQTACAPCAS